MPLNLLNEAYKRVYDEQEGISGSCTITFLNVNYGNGKLSSALLGDSGFLIVRNEKIVYRSKEQQHFFNAPFQLGLDRGMQLQDLPEHSALYETWLKHGDLIVSATDGLFDNIENEEILEKCVEMLRKSSRSTLENDLWKLSKDLTEMARKVGENPYALSPFAKNARSMGYYFMGGKLDDTTVLVTFIEKQSTSQCFNQ